MSVPEFLITVAAEAAGELLVIALIAVMTAMWQRVRTKRPSRSP